MQGHTARTKPLIGKERDNACDIGANGQVGVDASLCLAGFDLRVVGIQHGFAGDGQQPAGMVAAFGNRHGDANGGGVLRGAGPGVVGDCEDEGEVRGCGR